MTAFFEMDVGVSNWVGINILLLCLHPGLVAIILCLEEDNSNCTQAAHLRFRNFTSVLAEYAIKKC